MSKATLRNQVIIDPKVQWALARRLCFHWLAFFAVLLSIGTAMRAMVELWEYSFWEAAALALRDQIPMVVIMLVVLPLFLYDTLKLSNRFAGPMYRIRQALECLASGQTIAPLKFRRGDFWHEVAQQVNALRDRQEQLEQQNNRLTAENRQLKRQLAELPELSGNP
jgi:hypothetical protein